MNRLFPAMILACCALSAAAADVPGELIDFRVEDQFRKTHTRDELAGKVFVIVGSDRGGSGYNGAWSDAIHAGVQDLGLADRVVSVGLADLRGLPFFLKGMIRGKFSENARGWSIMDWKGVFPKAYGFEKDVSNILVFGPRGRLLVRTSGTELDPDQVRAILEKIAAALQ